MKRGGDEGYSRHCRVGRCLRTFECCCSVIIERCTGITGERCFAVCPCEKVFAHSQSFNKSTRVCQSVLFRKTRHSRICARRDLKRVSASHAHEGVCAVLEGVASANVLKFLGDLGRRSVQLLCHALLLVRVHAVKLLTQISVDHILERKAAGERHE